MQKKKTMIGWYFSRENKKLGHGDNRIIKLGRTGRFLIDELHMIADFLGIKLKED